MRSVKASAGAAAARQGTTPPRTDRTQEVDHLLSHQSHTRHPHTPFLKRRPPPSTRAQSPAAPRRASRYSKAAHSGLNSGSARRATLATRAVLAQEGETIKLMSPHHRPLSIKSDGHDHGERYS